MRRLVSALFIVILALAATPALAQDTIQIKVDAKDAGDIVGTVHDGEVTFITGRPKIEDQEALTLEMTFVPKIVQSIDKVPF